MNLKLYKKENIFQEMQETYQKICKDLEYRYSILESHFLIVGQYRKNITINNSHSYISHCKEFTNIIEKIVQTFFTCRKYEYYDKIDFLKEKRLYYKNQKKLDVKKKIIYSWFNLEIYRVVDYFKTDIIDIKYIRHNYAYFYFYFSYKKYKNEKEQHKVVKNSLNKFLNKDILYIVNSFLFENIRVSYNNKVYHYTCRCGAKLCFHSRKLHKKSKKHVEWKQKKF